MSVRLIIIICFIVNSFACKAKALPVMHPIHISVVNMDIKESAVLFSVKLFTDDFENIINQKNKTTLKFDKNTSIESVRPYVIAYIYEHLQIENNIKLDKADYKLIKMTLIEEAIWFYFEIELKNHKFESIKVKNSLMTDLFEDQTNLFILNHKGKDKAYSYNNSKREKTFVLD